MVGPSLSVFGALHYMVTRFTKSNLNQMVGKQGSKRLNKTACNRARTLSYRIYIQPGFTSALNGAARSLTETVSIASKVLSLALWMTSGSTTGPNPHS